jgi:hypothetical protein
MSDDFDAIVNGETFDAPQIDTRKSSVYFLAVDADGNSVYDLVVASRVVAHVVVLGEAKQDVPGALMAAFIKDSTGHAIVLRTVDGSSVIPTDGWTIKAPGGIPNRTLIKSYVLPRMAELLVRLHSIGV